MNLRCIDFGNILGAAGVQGPRFKGYWFHWPYQMMPGFNFIGMTPVDKTVVCNSRSGNVRPGFWEAIFPSWAAVRFWSCQMLNAMGLPSEGIEAAVKEEVWQNMEKPFMLSLAAVGETKGERMEEWKKMRDCLAVAMRDFKSSFGIQINLSCPNTGQSVGTMIGESEEVLEVFAPLQVPLMPKYSIASAPVEAIVELGKNPHCDAICVSNTIPFGWDQMDWKEGWGNVSPLAHLKGGGGLSGAKILPYVLQWIIRLRDRGFSKPINGGGGITKPAHVDLYQRAGASSCFLGSVATLRPWRVKSIIARANALDWDYSPPPPLSC